MHPRDPEADPEGDRATIWQRLPDHASDSDSVATHDLWEQPSSLDWQTAIDTEFRFYENVLGSQKAPGTKYSPSAWEVSQCKEKMAQMYEGEVELQVTREVALFIEGLLRHDLGHGEHVLFVGGKNKKFLAVTEKETAVLMKQQRV